MEALIIGAFGLCLVFAFLIYSFGSLNKGLRTENLDLKKELRELQDEIDRLREKSAQAAEDMTGITVLKAEVNKFVSELVGQNRQIIEVDNHLKMVTMENQELLIKIETQRAEFDRTIKAKDREISALTEKYEKEVRCLKDKNAELEKKVQGFLSRITELEESYKQK